MSFPLNSPIQQAWRPREEGEEHRDGGADGIEQPLRRHRHPQHGGRQHPHGKEDARQLFVYFLVLFVYFFSCLFTFISCLFTFISCLFPIIS